MGPYDVVHVCVLFLGGASVDIDFGWTLLVHVWTAGRILPYGISAVLLREGFCFCCWCICGGLFGFASISYRCVVVDTEFFCADMLFIEIKKV